MIEPRTTTTARGLRQCAGWLLVAVTGLTAPVSRAIAQPVPTLPPEHQAICATGDAPGDLVLRPGDFGAVGDGVTNDLGALRAAADALCAGSGDGQRRTLLFPPGTYRIEGSWTFGEYDLRQLGVAYLGCRNVRILGCNAKLDVQGDLHKSFEGDPATYPAGEPRYAHEYQMTAFLLEASSFLEIVGFEIDGNADQMTYDPLINAEGPDVGILTLTSHDWRVADVHVHHFGTDGLLVGVGAPPDTHFVLDRVVSDHHGRDALSLIQIRHGTVVDSTFRDAGDSGAHYRHADGSLTPFPGFSPSAGVAIEPDCGLGTPPGCETFDQRGGHVTFDRVQVLDNLGSGLSSAYWNRIENITVRDSTIRNRPGSAAFALWLADGLVENSTIDAQAGPIFLASYDPGDGIVFRHNVVTGTNKLLHAFGLQQDLLIEDNRFAASYATAPLADVAAVFVGDDLYCQDRAWRVVNNRIEIEPSPTSPHEGLMVAFGGLLESSGNTLVSSDPSQTLLAGYDQSEAVADQLLPADAWSVPGLAGCFDGSGGLAYVEGPSSCADESFAACHCEPVPVHDSEVRAPRAKSVRVPVGRDRVETWARVTVRNADRRERPGHAIQLIAEDGECPPGTVAGPPDFDPRAPGQQDTILLRGGARKTARVPLMIWGEFFSTPAGGPRVRCSLRVRARAAEVCSVADPVSVNDVASLEVEVLDRND